jgi:hypothetical protein
VREHGTRPIAPGLVTGSTLVPATCQHCCCRGRCPRMRRGRSPVHRLQLPDNGCALSSPNRSSVRALLCRRRACRSTAGNSNNARALRVGAQHHLLHSSVHDNAHNSQLRITILRVEYHTEVRRAHRRRGRKPNCGAASAWQCGYLVAARPGGFPAMNWVIRSHASRSRLPVFSTRVPRMRSTNPIRPSTNTTCWVSSKTGATTDDNW